MSEVRVNNLSNENNTGGPTISGITTYSGRHFFVPPVGDTASRPENCEPGSLRFNTDSATLEYFRGDNFGWTDIQAELVQPLGGGTGSNAGLGHRGVYGGASGPSNNNLNTLDFITIESLGDAQDFGDAIGNYIWTGCCSSHIRGLLMNGYNYQNQIQFLTFSSKGDTQDFGDTTQARHQGSSVSNKIRGIAVAGTHPAAYNIMDYVTIAQTGNAVDFGDVATAGTFHGTSASPTRGIIAGAFVPSATNVIQFITFMTTGDAQDFGDLAAAKGGARGCSNATRAVHKGDGNSMEFITIATLGNATDFGDLSTQEQGDANTCSSSVRGVFPGRSDPAGGSYAKNNIEFITFATTGNALDFGDGTDDFSGYQGYMSTGHGGL